MIPYDDLVAALSNWRAKQGLPVSTLGKQPSGGTPVPQMTQPGSGPTSGSGPTPGSGPRTAPPAAPPKAAPPLEAHDDVHEVDDAAMLDEGAYENEGNDFAMSFGGGNAGGDEGEATSIGGAPERPTNPNGGRGEDW
ncbi:MAG: hypothetical protein JO257_32625 [Deltaproteobacteria bacterium]|nr:hypothetical protein [Deltaproteobacteria bacterium]